MLRIEKRCSVTGNTIPASKNDKYLLGSVNNTLAVLDTLASKGPMTLAELERAIWADLRTELGEVAP